MRSKLFLISILIIFSSVQVPLATASNCVNANNEIIFDNIKFFISSEEIENYGAFSKNKFFGLEINTNTISAFGRFFLESDTNQKIQNYEINYNCIEQHGDSILIDVDIDNDAPGKHFCFFDLVKLSSILKNNEQILPGFCSFDVLNNNEILGVEEINWKDEEKISFTACDANLCQSGAKGEVYEANKNNFEVNKLRTKYFNTSKSTFSDISSVHPLYFQTKRASSLGFISGYPDGTFKPDNPVNRAEFAKMLTLAFGKGEGNEDSLSRFPDVLFDQWYIPFLSRAVELKIMEGYPDGSMKPGNTIIKAEALKMALEAKGGSYTSSSSMEQWYEKYRRYAADHFNLAFLSPEDMPLPMTRGECVELILEALDK